MHVAQTLAHAAGSRVAFFSRQARENFRHAGAGRTGVHRSCGGLLMNNNRAKELYNSTQEKRRTVR
jgi:hypothetical protein